jgi:flagellar basal-body rod modification protein FlgD
MSVDSIGTILNPTNTTVTSQNTVNQSDFIQLFLAQLQFQDPLQPVDNQEFLAQLAQFSNLQEAQETSDNTNGLLVMNSSIQALSLLNKTVSVESVDGTSSSNGTVTGVSFDSNGPLLTVSTGIGSQTLTGIALSQISLVTTVTPTN